MIIATSVSRLALRMSGVLLAVCSLNATASAATTLDNMQAAFKGESNAHVRYLAFARQADSEGFDQIASLFRAAARAEEIHAANHAKVIKELGEEPTAKIATPEVKTTRENLEAAIKGETYERDIMYPDFLKQARTDRNKPAIKSLNFAKQAEAEHSNLYTAALGDLDRLKGTSVVTFIVCPTCGMTTHDEKLAKCPTCFTTKERFEKVV